MRTERRLIALMAVILLSAAVAQAQGAAQPKGAKPDAKGTTASAPSAAAQAKQANEDPEYTIGADDVLNINVWKEAELTRTVPVRPDGKISLPLLNDVQAVGLTPLQLAATITEGLKKFIADPQVTVTVSAVNSRRYYVLGEVGHTGSFPLLRGMTVLQALANAGSFTQFANLKGIYVLRNEDGKQVKHPFNYKEVIKGNHPEQNIELKPGDTIVVP
jgi:polysaccharide export outer membrane protein